MVEPVTMAMLGVAAVGLISDFVGSISGANAAKKAATRQAAGEAKLTKERLRQLDVEESRMSGDTIAATAASRVKVDSPSPLMILAEQAKEYGYQKKITRETGATKAAALLREGRDVGKAYKYQSYSNLAKGASNIFGIMNQAGMFSKGEEG